MKAMRPASPEGKAYAANPAKESGLIDQIADPGMSELKIGDGAKRLLESRPALYREQSNDRLRSARND